MGIREGWLVNANQKYLGIEDLLIDERIADWGKKGKNMIDEILNCCEVNHELTVERKESLKEILWSWKESHYFAENPREEANLKWVSTMPRTEQVVGTLKLIYDNGDNRYVHTARVSNCAPRSRLHQFSSSNFCFINRSISTIN